MVHTKCVAKLMSESQDEVASVPKLIDVYFTYWPKPTFAHIFGLVKFQTMTILLVITLRHLIVALCRIVALF